MYLRHGDQVEGYLGKGHRSKVKVTRSKNVLIDISMKWLLEIIDDLIDGDAINPVQL